MIQMKLNITFIFIFLISLLGGCNKEKKKLISLDCSSNDTMYDFNRIKDLLEDIERVYTSEGSENCDKLLENLILKSVNKSQTQSYASFESYFMSNDFNSQMRSSGQNISGQYEDQAKTINLDYSKSDSQINLAKSELINSSNSFKNSDIKLNILQNIPNPYSKEILDAYKFCGGKRNDKPIYIWAQAISNSQINLHILYSNNSAGADVSIKINSITFLGVCGDNNNVPKNLRNNSPIIISLKLMPNTAFSAIIHADKIGDVAYNINFFKYISEKTVTDKFFYYSKDSCVQKKSYSFFNNLASVACVGDHDDGKGEGYYLIIKLAIPAASKTSAMNENIHCFVNDPKDFEYNGKMYRFIVTSADSDSKIWGFQLAEQY
jgi:hypothetical protein